ncbi:MAG: hypothetical protein M1813_008485 [Trichoglossum hirsutum]|nr:MAG: hypothetical protein M1813_008485 [Trichoglossum hirsutum]
MTTGRANGQASGQQPESTDAGELEETQSISTYCTAPSVSLFAASTYPIAKLPIGNPNGLPPGSVQEPIESPYIKLVRKRQLIEAPEDLLNWSGRG